MAKAWYILHTFTGYEGKIERTLRKMIAAQEIDGNILCDIKVPEEQVTEIKNDKKRTRKVKFLPGYVMLEMDLPELGWKNTCSSIRRIQGVTGFVGTNPSERPRPITNDEAKTLLQRSGEIKGDKPVVRQDYAVGETVKIKDGPFGGFEGTIDDIDPRSGKLHVLVHIFGRPTSVEVEITSVEKVI